MDWERTEAMGVRRRSGLTLMVGPFTLVSLALRIRYVPITLSYFVLIPDS